MNVSISIKLDHRNYPIWREQMENMINAYGLDGFIDGIMISPPLFLDFGRYVPISCFIISNRFDNTMKS